jgi:hypothetical protein
VEKLKNVRFPTLERLTEFLVPLVDMLIKERGFQPPLEVTLVDSCNNHVVSVEMNSQGVFRNMADRNTPLVAALPITATVTDSKGRTWSGAGSATY